MTRTIEQIDAEIAQIESERTRHAQEQLDVSDCALSSWADGITMSKLYLEREVLSNGGNATFLALTDLSGNPVPAKLINGKFGLCWALIDDNGRYTGFLPCCDAASEVGTPYVAKDAKIQKKGYRQIAVSRPAVVKIVGTGTGLSGSANACAVDPETGQGSCAWLPSVK